VGEDLATQQHGHLSMQFLSLEIHEVKTFPKKPALLMMHKAIAMENVLLCVWKCTD
jgi:hypothetical protein